MKQWHFMSVIALAMVLGIGVPGAGAGYQLLVTSRNSNNVLRYDGVTGQFMDEFIAAGSGGLSAPGGIAFKDGYIYVSSHNKGQASVKRYNAKTGAFVDNFTSGRADFPYANLVFGPDDDLYVSSEDGASNVHRFDGATGAYIGDFLSEGDNRASIGLAFGIDDNLYVSNYLNRSIDLYDGTTGVFIKEFVTATDRFGLSVPLGLAFGPDDNLYASGSAGIYRFAGDTGAYIGQFVGTGSGGLGLTMNHAFGPDDNLYVCNFNGNEIIRYHGQSGGFIDIFVSGGGLDRTVDLLFIPEPSSIMLFFLGVLGIRNRNLFGRITNR